MFNRIRYFLLLFLPLTLLLSGVGFILSNRASNEAVIKRDDLIDQTTRAIGGNIAVGLAAKVAILEVVAEQYSGYAGVSSAAALPTGAIFDSQLENEFPHGIFVYDGTQLIANTTQLIANTMEANEGWPLSSTPSNRFSPIEESLDGKFAQWVHVVNDTIDIIGGYNPEQTLEEIIQNEEELLRTANIYILDNQNKLIYQRFLDEVDEDTVSMADIEQAAGIARAVDPAQSTQTGFYTLPEGNYNPDYFLAYLPIRIGSEKSDWGVLLMTDQYDLYNAQRIPEEVYLVGSLVLPLLFFAAASLGFGYLKIVRPLNQLGARSAALGQGNFEQIGQKVGGIRVIQQLQGGLIDMSDKVKIAQANLRAQMGAVTSAQEDERGRLARELHDDTIQSMIGLHQRLQLIELQGKGASDQELQEMQEMVNNMMTNLRRVTMALRPTGLEELGLVPALEQLIRTQYTNSGIDIQLRKHGDMMRLTEDTEFALYRIVQEGINNVIKHAKATHIDIDITMTDADNSIKIHDDGKGFHVPSNLSEMAVQGHFGLLGIYERTEIIGGSLSIRSAPSKGTTLFVEF